MKNLKIKTSMVISYSIIAILVVLVCVMGLEMVRKVYNVQDERYQVYGDGYGDLTVGYSRFQKARILLRDVVSVNDETKAEDVIGQFETASEEMNDYFDEVGTVLVETDEKALFKTIQDNTGLYIEQMKDLISQYKAGADVEELFSKAMADTTYSEKADQAINELIELMHSRAAEKAKKIENDVWGLFYVMMVIVAIALVLTILLEIRMIKKVQKPLKILSEVIRNLEKGNTHIEVQKNSNDEFGILMEELSGMVLTMKKQAQAAEEIAHGNLCLDFKPNSEQDVLGHAIRDLVEDNNRVLSSIKEASMQVTTGSNEVASASQSLAQGSTEQASAIEQITASIAEIAERTKVNASDAGKASSLVHDTKDGAARGNEQMKNMIQAMDEINESSENISKIIKVIDDIAFQTNILALNAAVEAARAGMHGKGFAVVADEVRNLAGKSAAAASETAEMIEDSIQKVEHGSKLAQETAEALEQIVQSVDNIVNLVNGIADASNVQATSVAQIDQAISQVSQVVQTNSATSQQCAAASEELSNQAERLRELLGRYQLKDNMIGQNRNYSLERKPYKEEEQQKRGIEENSPYNYQDNIISLGSDYGKY